MGVRLGCLAGDSAGCGNIAEVRNRRRLLGFTDFRSRQGRHDRRHDAVGLPAGQSVLRRSRASAARLLLPVAFCGGAVGAGNRHQRLGGGCRDDVVLGRRLSFPDDGACGPHRRRDRRGPRRGGVRHRVGAAGACSHPHPESRGCRGWRHRRLAVSGVLGAAAHDGGYLCARGRDADGRTCGPAQRPAGGGARARGRGGIRKFDLDRWNYLRGRRTGHSARPSRLRRARPASAFSRGTDRGGCAGDRRCGSAVARPNGCDGRQGGAGCAAILSRDG